jgi:hypothetical protein
MIIKTYINKILNNPNSIRTWLLFFIVWINLEGCFQLNNNKLIKPFFPKIADTEQYIKDIEQIKDCYIANVEYYRTHPDKIDEGNLFHTYTYDYDRVDSLGNDSILTTPSSENLKVNVGDVYYSPDELKAIIFIVVIGDLHQKRVRASFNTMCLIGLRNNINQKFTLYPFDKYTIHSDVDSIGIIKDLESWFFNYLSKSKDMWGKQYRTNVGDTDFWTNNLLFDTVTTSESFESYKSDFPGGEKLYYFQTYSVSDMDDKHWDNHYKYNVVDCNAFQITR